MEDRYGALINKFNRMLLDDVDKLVQLDLSRGVGASRERGAYLMGLSAVNRASASADQSQQAIAQFHRYTPGVGVVNDLAWRLNSVGVYVDPNRMADLASNILATNCRLHGQFNACCGRVGRALALRADNVDLNKLNEVCALVEFDTKGRRIDTTGLTVTQVGRTTMNMHQPRRYVEKAMKLLAIYVVISDHTAPDFLCALDI